MLHRRLLLGGVLAAMVVGFGTISCQKMDTVETKRGPLEFDQAVLKDSIPLEFGELKAIHSLPEQSYGAVLWFEKPDKTLVAVRVNVGRGAMFEKALIIPRR